MLADDSGSSFPEPEPRPLKKNHLYSHLKLHSTSTPKTSSLTVCRVDELKVSRICMLCSDTSRQESCVIFRSSPFCDTDASGRRSVIESSKSLNASKVGPCCCCCRRCGSLILRPSSPSRPSRESKRAENGMYPRLFPAASIARSSKDDLAHLARQSSPRRRWKTIMLKCDSSRRVRTDECCRKAIVD